jgi:hypothetical protein
MAVERIREQEVEIVAGRTEEKGHEDIGRKNCITGNENSGRLK